MRGRKQRRHVPRARGPSQHGGDREAASGEEEERHPCEVRNQELRLEGASAGAGRCCGSIGSIAAGTLSYRVVLHLGPLSGATLCSSRATRPANTAIVREHAACDWTSYLREALQKL